MATSLVRTLSKRISSTDVPCIVQMQRMLKGREDVLSLAQGIVHWTPPPSALAAARDAIAVPATSLYGADDGLPQLKDMLFDKLHRKNGWGVRGEEAHVMVTAGANQAYTNVVISLLDETSQSVVFAPYYFNHVMAHQMTGITTNNLLVGPSDPETLLPDTRWLRETLQAANGSVKMVTLVNPSNPCGVVMPDDLLVQVAEMCKSYGCWLVVDNTYEDFLFDGHEHTTLDADHVVNIFSFSKAFGMMGWRLGYLAYRGNQLHNALLKVQDTAIICPPIVSQNMGIGALCTEGKEYVSDHVANLRENRAVVREALEQSLGSDAIRGGEGAIYFLAKLPPSLQDDGLVVEKLVNDHGVCVIPGSSCGAPGWIRVCFANLHLDKCKEAAERLRAGLCGIRSAGLE